MEKSWQYRWIRFWTFITGVLALCWLILRSGTRPNRFLYPCQQAAWTTATMAFGVPVGVILLRFRNRVMTVFRNPVTVMFLVTGLVSTLALGAYFTEMTGYHGPQMAAPDDYRATVYSVNACDVDTDTAVHTAVDRLLASMGQDGLKFYQSNGESLVSGPDGIVDTGDVVILKINYQWTERGGTNMDVLQGVLNKLVTHPDGFSGEIVVCENAQFKSADDFDRSMNNADDITLSPADVVTGMKALGHRVSWYDWTAINETPAVEYSAGNMADGYIVLPLDPDFNGRVSYPKFQTEYGTRISMKYGIWDPSTESYDRTGMTIINLPVLKSHGYYYGATACVKNYMGLVTIYLDTESHDTMEFGLLGALMAEIGPADLNILDCIWINGNPNLGPGSSYDIATRKNMLVAGLDPVATDMWAVTNILIPTFEENGFTDYPKADPEDPESHFRHYLDSTMYQLLEAGINATNDLTLIDAVTGTEGDFNGDGLVDSIDAGLFISYFTGPGERYTDPGASIGDFDCDRDVDCEDWTALAAAWTGTGTPSDFPTCDEIGCFIIMPSDMFHPGDTCYCNVMINNPSETTYPETPLFVILDVFGAYFFAPSFTDFDVYDHTVIPGQQIITVLPSFEWPDGVGNAQGILWHAAMTNARMTELFGNLDSFSFGWGE